MNISIFRNGLAFGIGFLFIVSSVIPITIGQDVETAKVAKLEGKAKKETSISLYRM